MAFEKRSRSSSVSHCAMARTDQRRNQCEQAVRALKDRLPNIVALRDVAVDDLTRFKVPRGGCLPVHELTDASWLYAVAA